jgi:hypothetical protein
MPCFPGRAPEMARRSPDSGQQPPVGDVPSLEEPSAAAELHVVKIPIDDSSAVSARGEISPAGDPASRFVTWMRRAGFGVHARVTVPAANAGDMLIVLRNVSLTVTWAVTVLVTLVITVLASVPVNVIVAITIIELIGFVIGALSVRRKRRG